MSEAPERLQHADRLQYLEVRVRFLEERVRNLRTSRRVLMNLLALREHDRRLLVDDLSRQNDRLNRRYARALFERQIALERQRREP